MALNVNPNAHLVFYNKLFGPTHTVALTVKGLLAAGVKFDTNFASLAAMYAGAGSQVNLPANTTALMKDGAGTVAMLQAKTKITEWVMGLEAYFNISAANVVTPEPVVTPLPKVSIMLTGLQEGKYLFVLKVVRDITGMTLKQAKELLDTVKAGGTAAVATVLVSDAVGVLNKIVAEGGIAHLGESHPVKPSQPVPTVAKPVPQVIQLKDAQAVGQKVRGTSSGSVYYCVAVSDHVRVAARIQSGGTVSIRAEWDGHPTEDLKKLKDFGMQMKGSNYGSMHLDSSQVPYANTVGAFLLGCGVKWNQAVLSGADFIVSGGI